MERCSGGINDSIHIYKKTRQKFLTRFLVYMDWNRSNLLKPESSFENGIQSRAAERRMNADNASPFRSPL